MMLWCDSSDEEMDDGGGVQPFSTTWGHDSREQIRSVLQSPGVGFGQYVNLPSGPVVDRLFRSVKRPRSQLSPAAQNEAEKNQLSSLLDGINLNRNGQAASPQAQRHAEDHPGHQGATAADPFGGMRASAPLSRLHLGGERRPIVPPAPLSPVDGKRRRSIPDINSGAKIGEHLGGNRRSKQLRNSLEGPRGSAGGRGHPHLERLRWLGQREIGRAGSPPAGGAVPVADWPPWTGDQIPRGHEVFEADPRLSVREAMRASCREALNKRQGSGGGGMKLSASMPELVMEPASLDSMDTMESSQSGGGLSHGLGGYHGLHLEDEEEEDEEDEEEEEDEDEEHAWSMVETAAVLVDNAMASYGHHPPDRGGEGTEEDLEEDAFLDADELPPEMLGHGPMGLEMPGFDAGL